MRVMLELLITVLLLPTIIAASTRILAPWNDYYDAVALETSEFVATLDPALFWRYLDGLHEEGEGMEEDHELKSWRVASALLESPELELLKQNLRFRTMSARIQAYRTLWPSNGPECETFAMIGQEYFCNEKNLPERLQQITPQEVPSQQSPLGHYFSPIGKPADQASPVTEVILYSTIFSNHFTSFDSILRPLAKAGKINYIYRHIISNSDSEQAMELSGYGLEFEVKEYSGGNMIRVSDENGHHTLAAPLSKNLESYHKIGFHAIQTILDAKNPLKMLSLISENVALMADAIMASKPTVEVIDRATQLAAHFNLPESLISINGAEIYPGQLDLHTILDFMRDYQCLVRKYLAPLNAPSELNVLARNIMHSTMQVTHPIFDTRTKASILLNDLEKDKRYKLWPGNLQTLLRPPSGQFYPLARNLVLVTIIIDHAQTEGPFVESLTALVSQMVPLQIALIILDDDHTKEDILATKALYSVYRRFGRLAFVEMLRLLVKFGSGTIEQSYQAVLQAREAHNAPRTVHELIREANADELRQEAIAFCDRLSITQTPAMFVNGRPMQPFNPHNYQRDLVRAYQDEIYYIQMALLSKELDESTDYSEWPFSHKKAYQSRHPKIFAPESAGQYLFDISPFQSGFVYSRNSTDNCAFTVLIFVNLTRELDRNLAVRFLQRLDKTLRKERVKIVPVIGENDEAIEVATAVHGLLYEIFQLQRGRTTTENVLDALRNPLEGWEGDLQEVKDWLRENMQVILSTNLPLSIGPVVSINGHAYGPFTEQDRLPTDYDMEAWLQHEWQSRTEHLQALRISVGLERQPAALTAMTLFQAAVRHQLMGKQYRHLFTGNLAMEIPSERLCSFKVSPSHHDVPIHLTALLNPFSLNAAKLSAILLQFPDHFEAEIVLNVLAQYDTIPTPILYRFRGFNGQFYDYPSGLKGALMLNTPSAWNVDGASDHADVDNLLLPDYTRDDDQEEERIIFQMRSLLMEGSVQDHSNGLGIAGIPIVALKDGKIIASTISIGATGYFQLALLPEPLDFSIPSNEQIKLVPSSPAISTGLSKNLAILKVETITESAKKGDILSRANLAKLFSSSDRQYSKTVNVFSIASGLTYERLIRIMMLSVFKHTKSPIKFWIVANFVTPIFQTSLKRMAQHYGFDYELVRFKWPVWLNAQTRKHRRIWAYKILFLDVLFPPNLDRVIYVDADQVMRGDIAELAHLDMKGAAYGFVPFCSSRRESEPYRFWKQGYWRTYLQDKPYHISALFVVDLDRLRQLSVADRLRSQYQILSHDPASLANLDQDLPNNLQHEVPIYSLPQEWLWCETWCDDTSKASAKSIDLCNNPARKESKLDQALRIIPEWSDYDREVDRILTLSSNDEEEDKMEL